MELTDGKWGLDWVGNCMHQVNIRSDILNESFTSSTILSSHPSGQITHQLTIAPYGTCHSKAIEDLLGLGPY